MEVVQVPTKKCGIFTVHIQGTKPKNAPVIITVPDLGCDHTYYSGFVSSYMRGRFCWCHMELPGQSFDASDWNTDGDDSAAVEEAAGKGSKNSYPTMKELAEGIQTVMEQLEISQAVLFGEGAGANLLSRVAILCDDRVLGLLLIHGRCTQSGPLQLLRDKMRNWKSSKLEPATEKYLLEHRFSTTTETDLSLLLKTEFLQYRENLSSRVNIKNLNLLTYSYAHRTSLADMIPQLNCPVLLVAGIKSDHRAGVRNMYETINKSNKNNPQSRTNVELIELEDTLSPLVEKPEKLAESTLFFFQGLGLVTPARVSVQSGEQTQELLKSPERIEGNKSNDSAALTPQHCVLAPSTKELANPSGDRNQAMSARFLNRQMSMAELDLPRGPDSLSSFKLGTQGEDTTSRTSQRARSTQADAQYFTNLLRQAEQN